MYQRPCSGYSWLAVFVEKKPSLYKIELESRNSVFPCRSKLKTKALSRSRDTFGIGGSKVESNLKDIGIP